MYSQSNLSQRGAFTSHWEGFGNILPMYDIEGGVSIVLGGMEVLVINV